MREYTDTERLDLIANNRFRIGRHNGEFVILNDDGVCLVHSADLRRALDMVLAICDREPK